MPEVVSPKVDYFILGQNLPDGIADAANQPNSKCM
jgi:hypothetical protein